MIKILLRFFGATIVLYFVVFGVLFAMYFVPPPGNDAPRVLVAVDRSLWNGVGLNRLTYVRKLRLAGVDTVLIEYPRYGGIPGSLLDGFDGLVLTGGGDVAAQRYGGDPKLTRDVDENRDDFEFELLAQAEARGLPVLGLCRGLQVMNVHRGGTLGDIRDAPNYDQHHNLFEGHDVILEPGSRLAGIYGGTSLEAVTTWHGQHVAEPGRGVVVSASSRDGIAEAIEVSGSSFMIGVQWHAEMPPWDTSQQPLFDAFAEAARAVD